MSNLKLVKKKYEIVGIQKGKEQRVYKSGTVEEIERDEMLNQMEHKTINDILRDMDCFSDYKHYAKEVQ